MKNIYLWLTFNIAFISAFGQKVERCGTKTSSNVLLNQPVLEQPTMDLIPPGLSNFGSNDLILVPVVVHVVHNTTLRPGGLPYAQNISDVIIFSQIRILNEDFGRTNSDTGNTPSWFQNVASDTRIQFFLTNVDEQGNPHSGITRRGWAGQYWYSTFRSCQSGCPSQNNPDVKILFPG